MTTMKRCISLILAFALLIVGLSGPLPSVAESSSSYKEYKYLALGYFMTYTEIDGKQHYAVVGGKEIPVRLGETVSVPGNPFKTFLTNTKGAVVSIEAYDGTNLTIKYSEKERC